MSKNIWKIFLVLLGVSFINPLNVFGELCDAEYIRQLKALADNVHVTQEYFDNKSDKYIDEFGNFRTPEELIDDIYYLNVNLISEELYLEIAGRRHYYDASKGGMVSLMVGSGQVNLRIHSKKCWDKQLRTITVDLPKFNVYSYRNECKTLSQYELDVCNPWYQEVLDDNSFLDAVGPYLPKELGFFDKIFNFVLNNYFYIVFLGLAILFVVVWLIRYRKKSKLE